MNRYLILASLAILAGVLVWVGLGTRLAGGPGQSEPQEYCDLEDPDCIARILSSPDFIENPAKYCDTEDPACRDAYATAVRALDPTPPPEDPRMREILMEDPVIQALIGTRVEGEDYWLDVTSYGEERHGGEIGRFMLVFAEPVSYEGEVVVGSSPCKAGLDERVDLDDPCIDEEREYSTVQKTINDARVFDARVDARRRQVFSLDPVRLLPATIEMMIEHLAGPDQQ